MARIKICGIRRMEDTRFINDLKPDYCGFILTSGFRRSIDYALASELCASIDGVERVGVFVDDDIDYINRYVANGLIDLVQLHGNEDVEYCKKIKAPIIKVLKPSQFDKIRDYEAVVDYFLFDSGTGTGKAFDWELIPKTSKPFFLAGGIDEENIPLAINELNPFALDMSSSVETDGVKDYDKIKNVINIVRRATNE